MYKEMVVITIKAGTLIKINGIPLWLKNDTEFEIDKNSIDLITWKQKNTNFNYLENENKFIENSTIENIFDSFNKFFEGKAQISVNNKNIRITIGTLTMSIKCLIGGENNP
ncbi:MAG: hypothetical protein JW866_08200 [Ignavibacteriales bacterium]|nr:hypothetical protein [Ignavibacteriales bacterium]